MPIPPEHLRDHLKMAERHVFKGSIIIARQKALIAKLETDGHDTSRAIDLLHQFEEIQAAHLADRDRVVRELAKTSPHSN